MILSCESPMDLPFDYAESRNISVLFYSYNINGTNYEDIMGRSDAQLKNFYDAITAGALPTTSQINESTYFDYFEKLSESDEVLHICLSSGITNSYNNAVLAKKSLLEKYPDRKVTVIDSLCASSGFGMLVDYAADMRDNGKSADEIALWLSENKNRIAHYFSSTNMKFLRRSGRVSGSAATIATVLNICPLMKVNEEGKLIAYGKVRGIDKVVSSFADAFEFEGMFYEKCYINHSDSIELAEKMQQALKSRFNIEAKIFNIGTTIASHCGKGTLALYFLRKE